MNRAQRRQKAREAWKGLMVIRGTSWRRIRKAIEAKRKLSMRRRIALTAYYFGLNRDEV